MHLKGRIAQAVGSVTQEMLQNVWQNLENRSNATVHEQRSHPEKF